MRVLFLASYIPSRFKGAEIRLLQLLRHLSAKHEVTLWAINRRGIPVAEVAEEIPAVRLQLHNPSDYYSPLRGRLVRFAWYRNLRRGFGTWLNPLPLTANQIYHPALKRSLADLLGKERFDLVVVNQIMVGVYLPRKLEIPVVLSKDNVWAELRRQDFLAAQGRIARWRAWIEWKKTHRYERRIVERSDLCVVVSDTDRDQIRAMAPSADIRVVPNGVDTVYFKPNGNGGEGLVFIGTMSWEPNKDAMEYFAADIYPRILARFPNANLTIVGTHPPKSIRRLEKQPNIRVTGEVPDVRPYVDGAAVSIVPLRSGSGTRLKILEALAMEQAVVSTRIGAEGLEVTSGEHLLLADTPEDFADAVCTLLNDPGRRERLGVNGRCLVERMYDWEILAARMDAILREAGERRL